jgi:uncharacterized protein YfeS
MTENFNDWKLSPEKAHPKAAKLLKAEFFWDCVDENSPFGNDNGADALQQYRLWRANNPGGDPVQFIKELLPNWQCSLEKWKQLTPSAFQAPLLEGGYELETGDDVIISVAFARLIFDGVVGHEMSSLALEAINREQDPGRLHQWKHPDERIERLAIMKSVLLALDEESDYSQ